MLAEQLILHVLIVLTPFLICSVFYENKKIGRMNILLGVLNGLAATFVMFFPIYSHGLYFDLRYVPLIIATLYGGPLSGGIVLIMILLRRTIMGGDALLFGYLGAILGILLPLLLYKTFLKCPPRMRVGIAILVGVWPTIFNLLISYYNVGRTLEGPAFIDRIQDLLILGAIQTIAIGFVAILTEIIFERNEIRNKIQRTEKLNTLGELAASIAHEVRNPLTVVKGFLQLMEQEEVGKKREYLTLVLTELGRAEQIINDYLNFAKPKLENIEILEINVIIDDVWHLLEPMAVKEGIQLEYESENPFYLKTDRNQLKQALVNIIKNAIEATPDGGKISIKLEGNTEHVKIVIQDNGKGMSKEQLDRIGTLFYTTKEKGTGLGTMVSIRIIEAMKGKIVYTSEEGKGTQVVITLPVVEVDNQHAV